MRLPDDVYAAVDQRKVDVFYAGRQECALWNHFRRPEDLRYYCGWYWAITQKGKVELSADGVADHGPYHSKSAAYKDAFVELALRRKPKPAPMQVTGSNIVKLQTEKTSGLNENRSLKRRLRRMGVR